ncbi:hypothetical protein [Chitinophaga vietnamensis]|uniref:hypothetical protein n=1 Tax=Chitinophaga vietnamensis TaxID=2593957 RepID=UPI00117878A2|nr:hypothetical protein [Chitinophaga vietnamensis]
MKKSTALTNASSKLMLDKEIISKADVIAIKNLNAMKKNREGDHPWTLIPTTPTTAGDGGMNTLLSTI